MLDVDFLREPSLSPAAHLIYRYRSGILRPLVRREVKRLAKALGRDLEATARDELSLSILAPSIFPIMVSCDAGKLDSELTHRLQTAFRGGAVLPSRVFLMVAHPGPRGAVLDVQDLSPDCALVEEPEVTPATLKGVLDYLIEQTDLQFARHLGNEAEFRTSFEALVSADPKTLPDFIKTFERRLLLQVDHVTLRFEGEPDDDDDSSRLRHRPIPTHLKRLVAHRSFPDLRQLVCVIDRRLLHDRETVNGLIARLYRATSRLLDDLQPSPHCRDQRSISRQTKDLIDRTVLDSVLWSVLVLAWEEQLSHQNLGVAVHKLGVEYVERSSRGGREDPMKGLWSNLTCCLLKLKADAPDPLSWSRKRIVGSLAGCLTLLPPASLPDWVNDVRQTMAELGVQDASISGAATDE